MSEETLAVFEIKLKVNDLHIDKKHHTDIGIFPHIFVLLTNFLVSL